jgi:hypothetical protein
MEQFIAAFIADGPRLLAAVIVFAVCFLIARLIRARQSIALAFAFTPLVVFWLIESAARSADLATRL